MPTQADREADVDVARHHQPDLSSFGGGVRMRLGKQWGLKPEVRYQRYNSSDSSLIEGPLAGGSAVQYTVGVFYQFGH